MSPLETILADKSTAAFYDLCRQVPPTNERPKNLRWLVFGFDYPKLLKAYREGAAGDGMAYPASSYCAAAYLAGTEARG